VKIWEQRGVAAALVYFLAFFFAFFRAFLERPLRGSGISLPGVSVGVSAGVSPAAGEAIPERSSLSELVCSVEGAAAGAAVGVSGGGGSDVKSMSGGAVSLVGVGVAARAMGGTVSRSGSWNLGASGVSGSSRAESQSSVVVVSPSVSVCGRDRALPAERADLGVVGGGTAVVMAGDGTGVKDRRSASRRAWMASRLTVASSVAFRPGAAALAAAVAFRRAAEALAFLIVLPARPPRP
jgi:hypothetical protein